MPADKPFIITSTEPCTENWETMQPGTNGRFCDQYQKIPLLLLKLGYKKYY